MLRSCVMEKFLHAFNLVPGLDYRGLYRLLTYFGDWQAAWEQGKTGRFMAAGLTEGMALKISHLQSHLDIEREYALLWEKDINLILRDCAEFPLSLLGISDPPFALYRKGAPLTNDYPNIAIVGSRVPSDYGEKIALQIAESIALSGGIVVSGLAFGIDAIAHFGAVKNRQPTVAVLASGLDRITPSSHTSLAAKILQTGGTILSEYAGDTSAYALRFLARNRIISGLSKVTIVIEAKKKSGALITARHANDQDRDVYALVGDITRPQAQGCLNLIIQGRALPILGIEDLLQCLGFEAANVRRMNFTAEEETVMRALLKRPCSTEELLKKTYLPFNKLSVALTHLELKSAISKNSAFLWKVIV